MVGMSVNVPMSPNSMACLGFMNLSRSTQIFHVVVVYQSGNTSVMVRFFL